MYDEKLLRYVRFALECTTFLLGLAYWEQKPRDSNERSGVGPPTLADPRLQSSCSFPDFRVSKNPENFYAYIHCVSANREGVFGATTVA